MFAKTGAKGEFLYATMIKHENMEMLRLKIFENITYSLIIFSEYVLLLLISTLLGSSFLQRKSLTLSTTLHVL